MLHIPPKTISSILRIGSKIRAGSSMTVDVRPSPIAGLWYEGDPKVLASTVDTYLERGQLPKLEGEVIAVVAPHAGHRYSGPVAGYAFAALRGLKPDLVAILSPFHNPSQRVISHLCSCLLCHTLGCYSH